MDTVVTLQGNVKKKCHTQNKRKRNKTNRTVRYKAQQNVTQIGKRISREIHFLNCISTHGLLHIVYSGPCSAHFLN